MFSPQELYKLFMNSSNEISFPFLVKASPENTFDFGKWMDTNSESFESDLSLHGAILFRGFNIDTAEKFNSVVKCFKSEPLEYMFRSSPRVEISKSLKNVYLSTTYPNDRSIQLHNETSYSRIWGRKIIFCCIKPADKGGETPIADSRKILKDLQPELVEKFRRKGVRYVRHLFPELGMPWQEVFQTSNKDEVYKICEKFKINIEFQKSDKAIISWNKPAIYSHPDTNEETWFNHILFFNKYTLYDEIGLEKDDYMPEEMLPSNTYFGDNTEITYDEYLELTKAYANNKISFPYEKGDVLFLDNMITAHGRNPYEGDRTIATAIIEPVSDIGYEK